MNFSVIMAFARYGALGILRTPAQWVPMICFPAIFFSFFGGSFSAHSVEIANMIVASYVAYAIIGVGILQFGVGIANERGTPWERYLRTLPVSASERLLSRVLISAIFAFAAAGAVVLVGAFITPMHYTLSQAVMLMVVAGLGGLPFLACGVALAYWVSPKAIMPIAFLLYFFGAFAGGLWIPPQFLPKFIAGISPYLPSRQFGEALWAAARGGSVVTPLLWLAVFCVAMLILATVGYSRDQRTRFV